jgi:hypothetical protein
LRRCPAFEFTSAGKLVDLSVVRWMALATDVHLPDGPVRYITALGHVLSTGDDFIVTRFRDRRSLMLKDRRVRPYRCFLLYDKGHDIAMEKNAPLRARGVDPGQFENTLRIEVTLREHEGIRRALGVTDEPRLVQVLHARHHVFKSLLEDLAGQVTIPPALDTPSASPETITEEITREGVSAICARCGDDPNIVRAYLKVRTPDVGSFYRKWRTFKRVLDDRRRGQPIIEGGARILAELGRRVS